MKILVLLLAGTSASAAIYTVQPGDTLSSLARRFNISVIELQKLNNLKTETIKIGVQLTVPDLQYKVAAGDNLTKIAAKYKTTVESLRQANNLTSDTVKLGQVLSIPTQIQDISKNKVVTIETKSYGSNPFDAVGTANSSNKPKVILASYIAPTNSQSNYGFADTLTSVAYSYLDTPYAYGGVDPAKGIDCSAYVQRVFAQLGISLPRVSADQANVGQFVDRFELTTGDLVFFHTIDDRDVLVSHVGIYLDNDKFINANSYDGKVVINDLNDAYWSPRYLWARRVLPNPEFLLAAPR